MDPDVCYYDMFAAMRDSDYLKARGLAKALKNWLKCGGFYPQKYCKVEVDAYLASVLRRTSCLSSAS